MLVFEGELLEGRNILELHYSQMYALRDNSQPHLPQNAKYPKVICNGVTFTKLELYEVGYTLTIKGEVYEVTKIEKLDRGYVYTFNHEIEISSIKKYDNHNSMWVALRRWQKKNGRT